MPYVTATDMQSLYDLDLLVRGTNYSDPSADAIDTPALTAACTKASGIVDSYLIWVKVAPSKFSARFLEVLRIMAGRIAIAQLPGVDESIHAEAEAAIEWLQSLKDLTIAELGNLTGDAVSGKIAPSVSFCGGESWSVTGMERSDGCGSDSGDISGDALAIEDGTILLVE